MSYSQTSYFLLPSFPMVMITYNMSQRLLLKFPQCNFYLKISERAGKSHISYCGDLKTYYPAALFFKPPVKK